MVVRINIAEQRASFDQIYAIDFGDEYHKTIKPKTELEARARKIRRKYRHIHEYIEAKRLFKEYMDSIYDQFPSKEIALMQLEAGNLDIYIPPKPQMKNNNEKKFYDRGMLVNYDTPVINHDLMDQLIDERFSTTTDLPQMQIHNDVADVKKLRTVAEVLGKDGKVVESYKNRMGKGAKLKNNDSGYALLRKFFENNNRPDSEEEEYAPVRPYSFTKQIMDDDEFAKITGDYRDPNEVIKYRGRYIKTHRAEEMKIFDDLGDLGWNSLKLMSTLGVSRKLTQIASREAKAIKKRKKFNKKRDKDFFVMAGGDEYEDDGYGIAGEGFSIGGFDDYEKEMQDMTSDSLFDSLKKRG